jgi:hypothetical protein
MEIAYSINTPLAGEKTTLKKEIFAPNQFAVIPEILRVTDPRAAALGSDGKLACGGSINGAIYPCDVSGHPTNPPDPDDPNAMALAEWEATYRSAQRILSVPSAQFPTEFPAKLRGYDGFRGFHVAGGVQFATGGNYYYDETDRDEQWLWSTPTP